MACLFLENKQGDFTRLSMLFKLVADRLVSLNTAFVHPNKHRDMRINIIIDADDKITTDSPFRYSFRVNPL